MTLFQLLSNQNNYLQLFGLGAVSTDLHEEQPCERNIAKHRKKKAPGAWGGGP